MRVARIVALAFALVVVPRAVACQTPDPAEPSPAAGPAAGPPPVVLPRTESRTVASAIVEGVTYRLDVALPRGYAEGTASYPVVYLLDADYSFAIARNVVEHHADRGRLPWAIVVGIAYDGPPRYRLHRTRDYTPTFAPRGGYGPEWQRHSGGGPAFRRALAEEILPFVESTYRTTGERTLVGHSYGGLFGTWVAFTEPDLFDRYVVVSPSLWYDRGMVFDVEAEYARAHGALDAEIYWAVGALEGDTGRDMVGDLRRFADRVEGRGYDGLVARAEVLDGETHDSVFPRALSNGLRAFEVDPGPR